MPDESYRELYDELATVRQEMAEAKAERDAAIADRERLIHHGITEDYVHGLRDQLAEVSAERDAIRHAATRVMQLVTHGADGLVVGEAIAEMRRVLDGGGQ